VYRLYRWSCCRLPTQPQNDGVVRPLLLLLYVWCMVCVLTQQGAMLFLLFVLLLLLLLLLLKAAM
jgi:hypothetical protein